MSGLKRNRLFGFDLVTCTLLGDEVSHLALVLGAYSSLNPLRIDSVSDAIANIVDNMIPTTVSFVLRLITLALFVPSLTSALTPFLLPLNGINISEL